MTTATRDESSPSVGSEFVVDSGQIATMEIPVRPPPSSEPARDECFAVQVRGLPIDWFTLSHDTIAVPAGEIGRVKLTVHPPATNVHVALGLYPISIEFLPMAGGRPIVVDARVHAPLADVSALASRLLRYLPGVFQQDPFLARFLLLLERTVEPIEQAIDLTHDYLNPRLSPASYLPWLASWVGTELEPGRDEATQRALVRNAAELARWKGTRRAIRDELELRTGGRPLIVENFEGMRLGQDAALGVNTNLGQRHDGTIAVTLASAPNQTIDPSRASELVEALTPAHVSHVLRIVPAPVGGPGGTSA